MANDFWTTWKKYSLLSSCPTDDRGAIGYWVRKAQECWKNGERSSAIRKMDRARALGYQGEDPWTAPVTCQHTPVAAPSAPVISAPAPVAAPPAADVVFGFTVKSDGTVSGKLPPAIVAKLPELLARLEAEMVND